MSASDSESGVAEDSVTSMSTLLLRTLGEGQLLRRSAEGDEVLFSGANKALALFTYLACAPGRGATRAHLQDLLWERQAPERAQGALRTYLWKLRTVLGANAIVGDEYVVLGVACEIDRDQLIEAADRGDAERVVAQYTGDFFPAFAQPDSPQFDLWVESERLRLRGIFSRCAERVVGTAIDNGRFRDALSIARRLRDSDPMEESGWRLLLQVLIASGDSINAANEASVLERLLIADERAPQPATLALLKAVSRMNRAAPSTDEAPRTLVAPLVARDREFGILTTSWARARAQSFEHVHVRAPAGMGKSRLLEDFTARLQHERVVVARARADMGRRDLPYAFIGAVIADLAGRRGAKGLSAGSAKSLLAINPALSSFFAGEADSATGDEALRRRILAISELVAAISDEQPIALILDDLQWADSVSCAVLAAVMSSMSSTACLVVTASRESLGISFSALDTVTIVLENLDVDAVAELVQSLAALPDETWAHSFPSLIQRSTSGVPLYVLDALTLCIERSALVRDAQNWRTEDPASLAQLIEGGATLPRRVESLSDDERTLVLVLAVAGEPCSHKRLADVSRRAPSSLDQATALLERSGYVTTRDEYCRIAHDSIADAVLALTPAHVIERVHADFAMSILGESRTHGAAQALFALRSAMLHASRSKSDDVLGVVFNAYANRARKNGDSRSLDRIAADVLNDVDSPEARARLIATMPAYHRVLHGAPSRWKSLAGAAVIAIVASLSGAWFATKPSPPEPDGELVFMQADSTPSFTLSSLPFSSSNWSAGTPIAIDDAEHILTLPYDPMLLSAVPTGRLAGEWIGSMVQADSGVTDLVRFSPHESPVRLTATRGDDLQPSVSPDGQLVAFATARWSDDASRSLATFDLRTRAVLRLTTGSSSDASPVWSPDGRRIAFSRTSPDGVRLCIVHADGRGAECLHSTKAAAVRPWAWQNDSILLFEQPQRLMRAHIDSATVAVIDSSSVTQSVSSDGRWQVSARTSTMGREECLISRIDQVRSARALETRSGRAVECSSVRWNALSHSRPPYVSAVRIDRDRIDPAVGIPHAFSAKLVTSNGDTTEARHIEWTSSDTSIAIFGANGHLYPLAPGVVTIRASYGGWRFDTRRVELRASSAVPVLQDAWSDSLSIDWVPFGEPRPRIVTSRFGERAFLNNGDGVFHSGVHSKRTFSTRNGLALDTWISAPITMDHWQVVRFGLYVGIDSAGLAAWDHRDAWAFAPNRQHAFPCEFVYPSGQQGTQQFATVFETAFHNLSAPAAWKSGARTRIRLQIFPDGRCGAAVNGQPVAIGAMREMSGGHANVFLYGNSLGTQMLVGSILVRKGVPPGVDWRALGQAASR